MSKSMLCIVVLLILAVVPARTDAQEPSLVAPMAGQGPPPVSPAIGPTVPSYATSPASPSVTGAVKEYLLTPMGDVEGLELQDGTDVRFPPHIGMAVAMAFAQQPTATIQASGYGTTNGFGTVVDAMTASLMVGSQSIPLTGPPGPPPPP